MVISNQHVYTGRRHFGLRRCLWWAIFIHGLIIGGMQLSLVMQEGGGVMVLPTSVVVSLRLPQILRRRMGSALTEIVALTKNKLSANNSILPPLTITATLLKTAPFYPPAVDVMAANTITTQLIIKPQDTAILPVKPVTNQNASLIPDHNLTTSIGTSSSPLAMTQVTKSITQSYSLAETMLENSTAWSISHLHKILPLMANYQPRLRRKAISSGTTDPLYADYLEAWRQHAERVGNANYPQKATRNGWYGNLVLQVTLRFNGDVQQVRIVHSSGYKLLDEAATSIVHLAAPFAPFPPAMRQEVDLLDITRTWQFLPGNHNGVYDVGGGVTTKITM